MKKLLMITILMTTIFSITALDFTGKVSFKNMLTQEEGSFNFENGIFTNYSTGNRASFNFLGSLDDVEVYRNDYLQIAIVSIEDSMLLIVSGEMLNGDVVIWKSYKTKQDELLEKYNEELLEDFDNEL